MALMINNILNSYNISTRKVNNQNNHKKPVIK